MQQQDELPLVVESLDHDHFLTRLFAFNQSEGKDSQFNQTQPHSIFQEPARYDEKDIERDYNSQCPPSHHKIKKNKKRKVVTNLVAKARRQRKNKLYIEMLQNRIFELQRQVEVLRKANNANKQSLKKNSDAQHIVNGFFVNRQRHYEKLLNYIKQTNIDEQKFMQEYGILRIRQGAVGKDRMKVINYYFKQLTEMMLPDLQKYILKTAQEQSDLFDPGFIENGSIGSYVQQWRKDMINDLQLSFDKIHRLSRLKDQIKIERQKMESYFEEFFKIKCNIVASSRQIQMIYDRLNSIFSPKEIAKCLCLIEKYKFQKGFSTQQIFKKAFAKLQQQQRQSYNPQNLYEYA